MIPVVVKKKPDDRWHVLDAEGETIRTFDSSEKAMMWASMTFGSGTFRLVWDNAPETYTKGNQKPGSPPQENT